MKVRVDKKPQRALTLKNLAQEVSLLRSFLIGTMGRDSEGTYRPEFVKDMLNIAATAKPEREFSSSNDFLRRFRSRA